MQTIDDLKNAKNLGDVARVLSLSPSSLSYVIYKIPQRKLYTQFSIPKKRGGVRDIHSPCEELKAIQYKLKSVLETTSQTENQPSHTKSTVSFGYQKGQSIVDNAWQHKNKRYVLNIDISDFFGSINFGRVRGFFMHERGLALHPEAATTVAQICCFNNSLPQGSPISPLISNMIGNLLDARLVKLAKRNNCRYSRYVDDITFSTSKKTFPKQIAKKATGNTWEISNILNREIERSGFSVNSDKVRMQYFTSNQEVTGLTVNKKVNINRKYYRQLRCLCDALFNKNEFYFGHSTDHNREENSTGNINQLVGMMEFVTHIKSKKREEPKKAKDKEKNTQPLPNSAPEKLYSKLLFFKYFYANTRPTILCEGKTDVMYLRSAIHALEASHPALISRTEAGSEITVNIPSPGSKTMRRLGLDGGTGQYGHFISNYSQNIRRFRTEAKQHPVIVLLDRDSGLKPVNNFIKKQHKTFPNAGNTYHISENLYVCVLPPIEENTSTTIENFFKEDALSFKIEEKSFNPNEKTFDSTKHYGKENFSRMVRDRRDKIDFSLFSLILSELETAIYDYSSRLSN